MNIAVFSKDFLNVLKIHPINSQPDEILITASKRNYQASSCEKMPHFLHLPNNERKK